MPALKVLCENTSVEHNSWTSEVLMLTCLPERLGTTKHIGAEQVQDKAKLETRHSN